ncbi:lytic transglycosylase domain-containing protein [Clostridium sp. C2-6-12]|uniref:lytic transglycosylase domain-containing protein n=1 Tax=Clostridium sp. C2-6-12 TaxID=2698832 RepID=UPI00136BCA02|nr:lytic transglycosylase domain-containing protein [Clostridium sp. C2-6-12]
MAIDGLNQISNEQLLAMNLLSNGQVTNDSSSNGATSNEANFAFQTVMQNLMDKNSNKNTAPTTTSNVNKTGEEQSKDSKKTDTQAGNSADSNVVSTPTKGVDARTAQKYAAGQRLEDIPLILNNKYGVYGKGSNPILANRSDADLKKIYSAVNTAAKKYGVDSNLLLAIIKQESDFDPNSTSGCGAAGLMQIMPENFSHLGITDPYDVDQNINGGTKLFKEYLDQYDGNKEMALMAYNGGPGTMQKRGVRSASDLYKMPQETQNYVPKVMGYYGSGV